MTPPSTGNRTTGSWSESKRLALQVLFGMTIFISAFLLFQVQLIIGKYLLPWFGGTPAVFTTCILFFQSVLLMGYCYSYLIDGKLGPRRQAMVHAFMLLLAAGWLAFRWYSWRSPLLPDLGWKQVPIEHPFARLLLLLLASVAVPYFALSTTGPLLQRWYGRVCGERPYRLYAISNAGSLLGLISYPFVVEPALQLHTQAAVWGFGFFFFAVACISIAILSKDSFLPPAAYDAVPQGDGVRPTRSRTLVWLLLAATASLSLLATTNQICEEVAAVPLLWVSLFPST